MGFQKKRVTAIKPERRTKSFVRLSFSAGVFIARAFLNLENLSPDNKTETFPARNRIKYRKFYGNLISEVKFMKLWSKRVFVGLALLALALSMLSIVNAQPARTNNSINVPVNYYHLPNGLRVVLSPERSAPLVTAAVYYNIGFRIEPKDRTGFAHLFEHLMFQGSKNMGKMEYIRLVESNGGVLNGSTRFDFTNYFAVVPVA